MAQIDITKQHSNETRRNETKEKHDRNTALKRSKVKPGYTSAILSPLIMIQIQLQSNTDVSFTMNNSK